MISPRPTASTEGRLHLKYLDGLRAVAAVWVVLAHALAQVDPDFGTLGTWRAGGVIAVFSYGRFAVDLFIVLSGFCLMLPVVRRDGVMRYGSLEFLRRRGWRILPPYYLALIFSLALIWLAVGSKTGTHWDISLPVTPKSILTHLLLFQDAFGEDFTINHALWSIGVEWRIYFFFPLLVFAGKRFGYNVTACVTILGSVLLARFCQKFLHATLTMNYLGLFAMGMWSAGATFGRNQGQAKVQNLPWGIFAVVLGCAAVAVQNAPLRLTDVVHQGLSDYVAGAAFASAIIGIALHPNHALHRWLSSAPVVFVGTFAYSVYLIHAPLLQVFWQTLTPLQSNPWGMFVALALVGTPIILAAAYGFYLLCEKPFLHYKIATPRSMIAKTIEEPAP